MENYRFINKSTGELALDIPDMLHSLFMDIQWIFKGKHFRDIDILFGWRLYH